MSTGLKLKHLTIREIDNSKLLMILLNYLKHSSTDIQIAASWIISILTTTECKDNIPNLLITQHIELFINLQESGNKIVLEHVRSI